jgi:site-specific DNA-methyltransferase (adenine-specific)
VKSKVLHIDCIAGLTSLCEPISVIVTSPPYNIGLNYHSGSDSKPDYLAWMELVFVACRQALSDKGHFFLQVGGIATRPTIPWEVLSRALSAHFVLQNEIIWVKNISLSEKSKDSYGQFKPVPSERLLTNTHEFIFHLTKTGKEPIDRLAVGVPLKYKSNIKRFGHTQDLRCRGNSWFIPYETIQSKADRHNHPAVFPTALPEMCIKLTGVPKDSLVVDPFVGTGTTLVACGRLGMRGIGFDISSEYCKIAENRLKENK